jgi:glycosyltransferase involved in cell wall biosynthesis
VKPLLVDLETEWRGGQNQALLLLKGLRARGHEPELVAARGSALGKRAAASGVPVHLVSRGWFRLPAARRIRTLLSSGRFDAVHANEAHAVTAVWLARAHSFHVPFVISRRVGYPIGDSGASKAQYNAAARIVANSRWVAEQAAASGAKKEKLTVVHEGADIPQKFSAEEKKGARKHWGISDGAPVLGCVGVLLPDKGQEWLIRALVETRKDFSAAKLLLAGDGPCRSKLEALARELQIADAVIFGGFVEDVGSVYAALDVFLLPSFFEAFNNSLLAAMAYEIPSIAFNRGALGEIIEDGQSGLLVSGPDTGEISGAVVRVLRDREFAKQIGEAGRTRIERNFSAAQMVERMIQVYKEVSGG